MKRLNRMRHCCKNCHFLTKYTSAHGPRPWDKEDRLLWRPKGQRDIDKFPEENRSSLRIYKVGCYRGEWESTYNEGFSRQSLKEEIWRNREGECSFVEYPAGKTFPEAIERYREKEERRAREQNSRSSKISIFIGVAGIVIGAVIGVLGLAIAANR